MSKSSDGFVVSNPLAPKYPPILRHPGKSALAISRDLGLSYKAAFVLLHKLREAMAEEMKGRKLGDNGKRSRTGVTPSVFGFASSLPASGGTLAGRRFSPGR
jgi:hypothetical protein